MNQNTAIETGRQAAEHKQYSVGQALAGLQLFKDVVTILQLNFLLIFAIIIPIGVPGLVLFACRWRFALKPASREATLWHWALTLAHELVCIWIFVGMSHEPAESGFPNWSFLAAGYCLGAFTSLLALVEAFSRSETSAKLAPPHSSQFINSNTE